MSDLLQALPGTVEGQKAIKNNVQEMVDAIVRTNAERDLIKEIKEVAKEKWGVDPAWLYNQAVIKHDRDYNANTKNMKALDKAEQVEMNEETFKG